MSAKAKNNNRDFKLRKLGVYSILFFFIIVFSPAFLIGEEPKVLINIFIFILSMHVLSIIFEYQFSSRPYSAILYMIATFLILLNSSLFVLYLSISIAISNSLVANNELYYLPPYLFIFFSLGFFLGRKKWGNYDFKFFVNTKKIESNLGIINTSKNWMTDQELTSLNYGWIVIFSAPIGLFLSKAESIGSFSFVIIPLLLLLVAGYLFTYLGRFLFFIYWCLSWEKKNGRPMVTEFYDSMKRKIKDPKYKNLDISKAI